jgi:hypothetical protein
LQIVTIPGGDHINTFTKPEFATAIKEFLDKHPAKKEARSQ